MKSNSSWLVSLKLFLISAGVLSLAVWVKFFIPSIIHFAVREIPALWSILLSLLKPPYLFVIINGIIITIAAASRFHYSESEPSDQSEKLISVKTLPSSGFASVSTPIDISTVVEEHSSAIEAALEGKNIEDRVVEVKHVVVNDSEVKNDVVTEAEDEDELIVSNSTYNFSGAKAFRVTRPETHETLESIWKMITKERHAPLTRPSKKLDTWKDHAYYVTGSKNRVNYDSPRAHLSSYPSLKVRKELSVGHRELNRRAEAFIKKINDEMRMQRQESSNQYGDN